MKAAAPRIASAARLPTTPPAIAAERFDLLLESFDGRPVPEDKLVTVVEGSASFCWMLNGVSGRLFLVEYLATHVYVIESSNTRASFPDEPETNVRVCSSFDKPSFEKTETPY